MTKRTQTKLRKPSKRKPTGAIVESAIRKVMDEVENELPDKQDIWLQFFEQFVGLVLKDEETLEDKHVTAASLLADRALEELETRFPGVLY